MKEISLDVASQYHTRALPYLLITRVFKTKH
jgi:hypothetical protein